MWAKYMKSLFNVFSVKSFALIGACLMLGACTVVTAGPSLMPGLAGIQGVTVIGTGKTIVDHVVSMTSGKNCSTLRRDTGRTYCEEDEVAVPDEVYCYNTLGNVTCYSRPAPHGEEQNTLGHIAAGAGPVR